MQLVLGNSERLGRRGAGDRPAGTALGEKNEKLGRTEMTGCSLQAARSRLFPRLLVSWRFCFWMLRP